jgi:hypothetical protein
MHLNVSPGVTGLTQDNMEPLLLPSGMAGKFRQVLSHSEPYVRKLPTFAPFPLGTFYRWICLATTSFIMSFVPPATRGKKESLR